MVKAMKGGIKRIEGTVIPQKLILNTFNYAVVAIFKGKIRLRTISLGS
jgi:hypothetical protein